MGPAPHPAAPGDPPLTPQLPGRGRPGQEAAECACSGGASGGEGQLVLAGGLEAVFAYHLAQAGKTQLSGSKSGGGRRLW